LGPAARLPYPPVPPVPSEPRGFDYDLQPSIDGNLVADLAIRDFVREEEVSSGSS
jgi:hypothetical protein